MSNLVNSGRQQYSTERECNAGFTLVEVLVVLALIAALSMIMIGMIQQLHPIMTAREKNDAVIEVEALAGYIGRIIKDAQTLPLTQKNPKRRVMMLGGPRSVTFVAAVRVGSNAYGLRDIRIFLNKSSTNHVHLFQSLEVRRREHQAEPDIVELAQVDELNFQYLEKPEYASSSTSGWRDHWSEPGRLPISVAFDLSITRSGHKVTARRVVNLPAALP